MDLILWRHAHAEALAMEPEASASVHAIRAQDAARRLTAKGQRQAAQMAQWLHQHVKGPTMVWASPAVRAQETAQALGMPFETQLALAPHMCADDALSVMPWPDAAQTMIVVGHQPTLGVLAARLMCGQDLSWSVKKGSVWWLKSRVRHGQREVTLHAVQVPELL